MYTRLIDTLTTRQETLELSVGDVSWSPPAAVSAASPYVQVPLVWWGTPAGDSSFGVCPQERQVYRLPPALSDFVLILKKQAIGAGVLVQIR